MMNQLINFVESVGLNNFEVVEAYAADKFPLKVNLVYGTYVSGDGSLYLLPVVKKVEKIVVEETTDHGYISMFGVNGFSKAASSFLLGNIEKRWNDGSIFGVQGIGGTGALKVGAEFLFRHKNCTTVYYPNPSWEKHGPLFSDCGYHNVLTYRYLKKESNSIDFKGFCEDISHAPQNSVILLHACGHNPTGLDLSKDQWKKIAEIIKEHKLVPFFDIAYQGFAVGIEEDTWAVRYFLSEGFEFLCAQSFSKMFTFYNERVGNLTLVLNSTNNLDEMKYNVGNMVLNSYDCPPNHGARVVHKILNDPVLFNEWSSCFKVMIVRMKELRKTFRKALEELNAPGTWDHITNQSGMFIYLNFTTIQVEYLRNVHHIYMADNGRVNLTGLNKNNIDYVAKAINDTLQKHL